MKKETYMGEKTVQIHSRPCYFTTVWFVQPRREEISDMVVKSASGGQTCPGSSRHTGQIEQFLHEQQPMR